VFKKSGGIISAGTIEKSILSRPDENGWPIPYCIWIGAILSHVQKKSIKGGKNAFNQDSIAYYSS
jgi:hypothetical protein